MSKNSEIIEDFKKSLSATIKSIGKKEDIEINFVKENPSIIGNTINLTEPKIENFKNNLEYLRAEADSFALEFRLHSKDIHQNFLNQDELSNEIINVLEQARVEAIGSNEFKGIQKNLKNKYIRDLKIGNNKKDQNSKKDPSVNKLIIEEEKFGLKKYSTYKAFGEKVMQMHNTFENFRF